MKKLISNLKKKIKEKIKIIVLETVLENNYVSLYHFIVHGKRDRLHLHETANPSNTLFNTRSGHITVGANTIFSHNCQVLTGRHLFENGKLKLPKSLQVPDSGFDVVIGAGCWIASGSIIIGGVKIGDDCLIMAGAVVTRDIPDGMIVGGVPAVIIGKTKDL